MEMSRQKTKGASSEDGRIIPPAPGWMSKEAAAVWDELLRIAPAEHFMPTENMTIHVFCCLTARMRSEGIGGRYGLTGVELHELLQCIELLRLSPPVLRSGAEKK